MARAPRAEAWICSRIMLRADGGHNGLYELSPGRIREEGGVKGEAVDGQIDGLDQGAAGQLRCHQHVADQRNPLTADGQ